MEAAPPRGYLWGMAKHSFTRRQWLGIAGGAGAAIALGGKRAGADCGPSLETRLVTEYGARYPIANAGMSFVGLEELAIAVANAGGIGMYGAAPEPPPVVDARLAAIDAATSGPFGVDFIVASSALGDFTTQDHIDVAAAHQVPVVAFHWAVPPVAWIDQLHAAGSRVWVQAGDPDFARDALAAGADGIIAQGRSAGGHNRNSTIPTLVLVERIRAEVSETCLLLAAGGIATGERLVRAIAAGADGGWMGTRFVAATESYAHPEYKQRLVHAGPAATAFTTAFGPEWSGQQQRVLRDAATANPGATMPATIGATTLFPGSTFASPYTMPNHSAIVPTRDTSGDFAQMDMPAGSESVLAIGSVRSAHQIIQDIVAEALAG